MPTVTIEAFQCSKCGYIWIPQRDTEGNFIKPGTCAKIGCRSTVWDREAVTDAKL